MSEKTLKPCPFCGEKVEIKRKTGSYGYTSDSIYINCCGVRLGEYTEEFQPGRGMYDTTKEATNKLVSEWNTRAKHLPKDCEWEYRDVPAQGSGCGWHEVYHPEWKFCPYCGGVIVTDEESNG